MGRIAIVNDIAGVARVEAAALRRAGWDVDFYDLPKPAASWPAWAKVLAVPWRLVLYTPIVLRLRRGRYDLVHVHFLSQGVVGAATGRPYLLHAHGSDLHLNFGNPLLRWWSRLWMRRAAGIFYVTPNLAPFLSDFEAKSRLLPNPIDTDRFAGTPAPRRIGRVLIFMRLAPIKGAEVAFSAAKELASTSKVSALDWGPLASEYRRRFAGEVEFLPPVPASQVPELLGRFDAVVGQMEQGVPGLSELEAMASGRVVFMRLDKSLYPTDPPPVVNVAGSGDLVTALRRLQGDSAEVVRLSVAGREWVRRNDGVEAHVRTLAEVYRASARSG